MNELRTRIADWLLALSDWVAPGEDLMRDLELRLHDAAADPDEDFNPITTWQEFVEDWKHRG